MIRGARAGRSGSSDGRRRPSAESGCSWNQYVDHGWIYRGFSVRRADRATARVDQPFHRHRPRGLDQHHVAGLEQAATSGGGRGGRIVRPRGHPPAGQLGGALAMYRPSAPDADEQSTPWRTARRPSSRWNGSACSPSSSMSPATKTFRRRRQLGQHFHGGGHAHGVGVVGVVDDRDGADLHGPAAACRRAWKSARARPRPGPRRCRSRCATARAARAFSALCRPGRGSSTHRRPLTWNRWRRPEDSRPRQPQVGRVGFAEADQPRVVVRLAAPAPVPGCRPRPRPAPLGASAARMEAFSTATPLDAAELLQVRRADGGDDGHVGPGDVGQRGDLAGGVGAQLADDVIVGRRRRPAASAARRCCC